MQLGTGVITYSAVKEGGGGNFLHFQDDSFMNTLTEFVSGAFDPWINSIISQVQIGNILEILESSAPSVT